MEGKELDHEMAQYEGNFLHSADIMSCPPITVVISEIIPPNTIKDAKGNLIDKTVLGFEHAKKRFILNKTNRDIIKMHHGPKYSGWFGKPITIGVRYLAKAFKNERVPCLRVVPPDETALPVAMRPFYGTATPDGN